MKNNLQNDDDHTRRRRSNNSSAAPDNDATASLRGSESAEQKHAGAGVLRGRREGVPLLLHIASIFMVLISPEEQLYGFGNEFIPPDMRIY